MAESELKIVARATDEASQDLKRMQSTVDDLERKSKSAGSALSRLGQTAGGVFTGMLGVQVFQGVVGGFQGIIGSMIDSNSELETLGTSFEILLSDAAAAGNAVEDSAGEMTDAMNTAAIRVSDAQEKMTDAAEDHASALSKIGNDMTKASQEAIKALSKLDQGLNDSANNLGAKYAVALGKIAAEEAKLTQAYQEQIGKRGDTFKSSMGDLEINHGKMVAGMQAQLKDLQALFDQQAKDRKARYADEAQKAPDRFLREREAAKSNADFLSQAIQDEIAKGAAADRALLDSLSRRLNEENAKQKMSFGEYQALLQKRQQEEEKAAVTAQQKQVAALQQRIADENAQFEQRRARLKADYDADLMQYKKNLDQKQVELVKRQAEEQKEYADAIAKLQGKYAEDVANVKAAEAEKITALKERIAEEQKSYARIVRDAEQAMNKATAAYEKATKDASKSSGASVNQMQQMYDNLAKEVGKPLETAKERAGAMLEWIKRKAKETPFDLPEVQQAAQRLIAYQLDATNFLDTVGNVAAGMNVPVKQVADAFGALATGQLGEAVMRFREFGVNLKSIEGLKFDAQGSLVTPVEEALEKIKAAMDERFGGMMVEQSKTFKGITSNLRDAWGQFTQILGKPIFASVRDQLKGLLGLVDENQAKLQELGVTIGTSVAEELNKLKPLAAEALTGLFDWVKSGQAKTDINDFLATAKDIVTFTVDVIKFGKDAAGAMQGIAKWISENETLVGTLLLAVSGLALFLGGPLTWAIAGIALAWKLAGDDIMQFMGQIRDFWGLIIDEMGRQWGPYIDSLIEGFKAVGDDIMTFIGQIGDFWGWLLDGMWTKFTKWWDGIMEGFTTIWGWLKGALELLGKGANAFVNPPGMEGRPRGYASGGVVPGPRGAAQLAVVHGGETITPPGMGGGNVYITVQGSVVTEREIARIVRDELSRIGRRTVTGGVLA